MRTALVTILSPVINRFPGMKNIAEPVFIQTLIEKAAVNTLNFHGNATDVIVTGVRSSHGTYLLLCEIGLGHGSKRNKEGRSLNDMQ